MAVIIRKQSGYRRAHFITQEDAEELVAKGLAFKHTGYEFFEEIEATEGAVYATKVMEPVKRRGRYAKVQDDESDQGETE